MDILSTKWVRSDDPTDISYHRQTKTYKSQTHPSIRSHEIYGLCLETHQKTTHPNHPSIRSIWNYHMFHRSMVPWSHHFSSDAGQTRSSQFPVETIQSFAVWSREAVATSSSIHRSSLIGQSFSDVLEKNCFTNNNNPKQKTTLLIGWSFSEVLEFFGFITNQIPSIYKQPMVIEATKHWDWSNQNCDWINKTLCL